MPGGKVVDVELSKALLLPLSTSETEACEGDNNAEHGGEGEGVTLLLLCTDVSFFVAAVKPLSLGSIFFFRLFFLLARYGR